MHFKALDNSAKRPKKKAVNNESENAEREQIDRQSKNNQNRLDSNADNPPQKRKQKRRAETPNIYSGNNIRQNKKRPRANEPFEEEHKCEVSDN